MKSFGIYLLMQIKRVVKIFPIILITTLLLCGCLGVVALAVREKNDMKESNIKVQVGLVGDIDNYMGVDIKALIRLLSKKFGIEFTEMTEKEAREALRAGKLSTYVLIPEGLVDDLSSGANELTVTYVGAEGQKGISSIIMDEVAGSISGLITTSQSAIYGMQNFLIDQGRWDELYDATNAMNYAYIGILTNIFSVCDLQITGIENHVSLAGYYLCSILILFMMLSGINSSHLFTKKNMELPRLLAARGQGVIRQVIGEYLAYLLLMIMCLAVLFGMLGVVVRMEYFSIPEWEEFQMERILHFFLQMTLVAAVICALQFLIYEMVTGIISSILLQFLGTLVLGYLSGCFYPLYFFPEGIQRLGAILPVGVAISYANGCLLDQVGMMEIGALLGYLVLFLGLAIIVRRRRTMA